LDVITQDAPARTDVRRGGARPAPTRAPELEHLSLDELRAYRQELSLEETRVSYWRRILQARLDTVTDGREDHASVSRIREVLHEHAGSSRRLALLPVASPEDAPPLPNLATLWETTSTDAEIGASLVPRLVDAEHELSAYRTALHQRLDAATSELIWRYRDQPALALTALPLPSSAR
jgi:hypothetical protein